MTGTQLGEWRRSMGLTKTKAAALLGVGQSTYYRWEDAPDVSELVRLATLALSLKAAWPAAVEPLRVVSTLMRHG